MFFFFQNTRVLFNVRVVGGSAFYSYLSPQDGRPLFHPAVDRWGRRKFMNQKSSSCRRTDVSHKHTHTFTQHFPALDVLIDLSPELKVHLSFLYLLLDFVLHSFGLLIAGIFLCSFRLLRKVQVNKHSCSERCLQDRERIFLTHFCQCVSSWDVILQVHQQQRVCHLSGHFILVLDWKHY